MAIYLNYRNGYGDVEPRIRNAAKAFHSEHGLLPACIVVNPTELDKARAVCKALELKVPVKSIGGCLVPEVWLQIPEAPSVQTQEPET